MTKLEKSFMKLISADTAVFFDDSMLKKIFAVLHISNDPVSLEDIAERSSLSLASVSNKSKILLQMGVVNRIKKPGSRKVFLQARTDFISLMHKKLIKKSECTLSVYDNLISFLSLEKKRKLSDEEELQLKNLEDFGKQLKKINKLNEKLCLVIEKEL